MTSMIRLSNGVTVVPKPRLHPLELRCQEFEVMFFLVNPPSLITEKFPSILNPKLKFPVLYDGATSLTTADVVHNCRPSDDLTSSRRILSTESQTHCCQSSVHGH